MRTTTLSWLAPCMRFHSCCFMGLCLNHEMCLPNSILRMVLVPPFSRWGTGDFEPRVTQEVYIGAGIQTESIPWPHASHHHTLFWTLLRCPPPQPPDRSRLARSPQSLSLCSQWPFYSNWLELRVDCVLLVLSPWMIDEATASKVQSAPWSQTHSGRC